MSATSCGTAQRAYLARAAAPYRAPAGKVTAQHVCITFIHRRAYVVELGDERVLEPVDAHLGRHDCQHGLGGRIQSGYISHPRAGRRVEVTYIGDRPEGIIPAEPAEALRESEAVGEGERGPVELDEVAKRHDAEHERKREALDDICPM